MITAIFIVLCLILLVLVIMLGSQLCNDKSHHGNYVSFAYSALAAMRTGISGSASFQSVRKS